MDQIYDYAKTLIALPGVSGDEGRALPDVVRMFGDRFDETGITPVYSFYGIRKSKKPNAKTVLLDAHFDTIGFVVTQICDGGFVKVASIGRTAEKNLSASEVWIYGKQKIAGVFASKPPHLQEPGESEKKMELSSLSIDTGLSKEALEEVVRIGNYVGFKSETERLNENIAVSPSFDDRICAAAHLRALDLLGDEDLGINIAVQFSAQEETGYKGAMTTAYRINPDYAIVMDVGHAYVPGAPERRKAIVAGGGCMLSYSPQTNRALSELAEQTAIEQNIPYQLIAEPGRTGTNSNAVQTVRGGVPVCLISVPLKNMHTANEIVDLRDALSGAKLVAALLREIAKKEAV